MSDETPTQTAQRLIEELGDHRAGLAHLRTTVDQAQESRQEIDTQLKEEGVDPKKVEAQLAQMAKRITRRTAELEAMIP